MRGTKLNTCLIAVTAGLLLLAPQASALSKHVFSTSFGSSGPVPLTNPTDVGIDQATDDTYVANTPENNHQLVSVNATGGTYTLTFKGQTTTAINYSGNNLGVALEALSAIGPAGVEVQQANGGAHTVIFKNALGNSAQPQMTANPAGLTGGSSTVVVSTTVPGTGAADIEKFTPAGAFVFVVGGKVNRTKVEAVEATEGHGEVPSAAELEAQNLCTAASGDTCQQGIPGSDPGYFEGQYIQNGADSPGLRHRLYLALDPQTADLYVGDPGDGLVTKFDPEGHIVSDWGVDGQLDGSTAINGGPFRHFSGKLDQETVDGVAVRDDGVLLVQASFALFRFSPGGAFLSSEPSGAAPQREVDAVSPDAIDPRTRDRYHVPIHINDAMVVEHFAPGGSLFESIGEGELATPLGVALDHSNGDLYVADSGNQRVAVFSPIPYLPDVIPSATALTPHSEDLGGEVDRAGAGQITGCHFEYGETPAYGSGPVPCASPTLPFIAATTEVSAEATSLNFATTYHYHLVAENAEHGATASFDDTFTTLPLSATIESQTGQAFAESALIHAMIDPGGGATTYRVEYIEEGPDFQEHEFEHAASTGELSAGAARAAREVTAHLVNLSPTTKYHYRIVASNASTPPGGVVGPDHAFTTLPFVAEVNETCPNAHVRQQTSAAGLLDCRAYELVSAADSAGYDVESNVVGGQSPFAGYPQAPGRVLYGVHSGGIPGTGHPTDRGLDPYIASRGSDGWSTEYVGIPADGTPSAVAFGSPLLGADAGLTTFAFGGPGLCAPCFSGAEVETGIPVHLPGIEAPIQGMAGPLEVEPTAKPDGLIAKSLSANGEHLVFGSVSQFAEGGNAKTGDVSIYDHNLKTGETHAVSNGPAGEPLPCLVAAHKCSVAGKNPNGIAELDISADGSRILIGQKVSEDADHNVYWRLYMSIDDRPETIELTPGASHGVLYAGMTADGSKVFFTTKDKLTTTENQDTDASADLYEADVSETEAGLRRISTGEVGTGDTNGCSPVSNGAGEHWNALGSEANCGVLAIGGGGGLASASGSIYFLSPEMLDSSGPVDPIQDQPNLYYAAPGQAPRFVVTLEPDNPVVLDALRESSTRHTADFQVTPAGSFAAFPSTLPLAGNGEEPTGHTVLYRYDVSGGNLDCVSCTLSGFPSDGNSSLASNGLSLPADGRVFFDSGDHLLASDTDERQDVYEWSEPGLGNCGPSSAAFVQTTGSCLALISAGTSTFDSGLLTASADGTDAFFFTRDSLAPQDENGPTMKIYDAREGGGFPYEFPPVTCKASDECHGAASPTPPPLQVGNEGSPSHYEAEPEPCKKGFLRRHGHCVKKPHHKHKHHKRSQHHKGGSR